MRRSVWSESGLPDGFPVVVSTADPVVPSASTRMTAVSPGWSLCDFNRVDNTDTVGASGDCLDAQSVVGEA